MADIPPASVVLMLVLSCWAVGTALFALLARVRTPVQPGHFKVTWLVAAGLAAAAAGAAAAGSGFERRGMLVLAAYSAACLVTFASVYRGADIWVGAVTAAAGIPLLAWTTDTAQFASAAATAEIVVENGSAYVEMAGRWAVAAVVSTAALLLGSVTNSMLLGHWHLNQPGLRTGPLRRLVWAVWGSIALFLMAAGLLVVNPRRGDVATLGAVTAIAFVGFTAVLAAMVHHLVRTRSIMSATGILYLQVLLCFVASFTALLGVLDVQVPL
ncbi:MAG TPA: hypothetical protein VNE62_08280 [Actinomycetota bacterium]|nr:hypothetical protein [Actinomycetota bacterium]